MATPVSSITRASTRKPGEPLNILCMPTHERYESGLCKTGHNFYAWRTLDGNLKDWDETYAKLPSNYSLLNPARGNNQIPSWIDFDLVLSQNKFGQYQIARQIADQLQLPLVSLEHTLPMPVWGDNQINILRKMSGDVNVFINDFSRKAWGWGEDVKVIHHGIDTDTFSPNNKITRRSVLLSVNNDWINRDWCLNFSGWKRISKGLTTYVIGKTPGLSYPAKDIEDLVNIYRSSYIYLNTTTHSPIPTALLESMACGCVPVSTATCSIPDVIINGENGFISNDENELRRYCQILLKNPDLCEKMGRKARETILEKFNMETFVKEWNNIFIQASEIIHIPNK